MSCSQTQHGEIVLPTAATAAVKKAVRDAVNAQHDQIYAGCQEFWRSLKSAPRTEKALTERFEEWAKSKRPVRRADRWGYDVDPDDFDLIEAIRQTLDSVCWRNGRKPRAVKRTDVHPKRMTNKDNVFSFSDFSISFNGRTVVWHVDYNNHAVDRAHRHPIAQTFFKAMRNVKWTRVTGGVIRSDDEYARDARLQHGGSVGISMSFGPVGEKEREREMFPYGKPRGVKVFTSATHIG